MKNLTYSDFVSASCAKIMCRPIAMLSDQIIDQTIGSSAKMNKSLQLCFRISFSANSVLKSKISADPPHKIWESHFNNVGKYDKKN